MLEFTSKLLPGTEVYKLYDLIRATCTEPVRAYQHLSIVAALGDPLPISHILELLGLARAWMSKMPWFSYGLSWRFPPTADSL
jgi:hypothetical protein